MSTRATYEFVDKYNSFTVYKHHDGYPEGGVEWIHAASELAWPLPRFEASEFAAAFVAANKGRSGDVYLSNGRDSHGDTEYHYIVTYEPKSEQLLITIKHPRTLERIDQGLLNDLLIKYRKA